jgi:hypothetical protein
MLQLRHSESQKRSPSCRYPLRPRISAESESERPFPMQSFETLLSLALSGCEKVHGMMVQTTRERSQHILQSLARAEDK